MPTLAITKPIKHVEGAFNNKSGRYPVQVVNLTRNTVALFNYGTKPFQ